MSAGIARKDFEIYANGVKRLEELEKELNFLNVDKKFPAEVASIRSKLKHVSEIPRIEYEIKLRKRKILGKTKKTSRSVSQKKIENLKKEIEKKSIQCKKFAPLSKDVLSLKLEIAGLRKKVKFYESEESRKRNVLKSINVGVDTLFNNTFNLSLNEIKARLSKEIENKETQIQQQLKEDLKRREGLFDEKYKEIERNFQLKYKYKVKEELQKEIHDKLEKIIKERLLKRTQLDKKELSQHKTEVKEEFLEKEEMLKKHFEKDLEEEKTRLKEEYNDRIIIEKVRLHKKLDSEVSKEILKIKKDEERKSHLLSDRLINTNELRQKLSDRIKNLEQVKKKKERLNEKANEEIINKKKEVLLLKKRDNEIEKEKRKIKNQEEKLLITKKILEKEHENIDSQKHNNETRLIKQQENMKKKVENLKSQLRREFEEKLADAIKLKEKQLHNRNRELEKEIKNKVSMFYS